jgi:hypothetical protein
MSVIVNFLPSDTNHNAACGWGYVLLIDGIVVNGRYEVEWTAEDAMRAGIAKAATAPTS